MIKSSQQSSKFLPKSQQTQTDFSHLLLLDLLKQKDIQISQLFQENELLKQRLTKYQKSPYCNPKLQIFQKCLKSKTPEQTLNEKHHQIESSQTYSRLIPKLIAYSPSETTTMLESTPHYIPSQIDSETGGTRQFSRLRKRSSRCKAADTTQNMNKIYGGTSKSSRRLIKNNSFVTDIVFNEEQTHDHWNHIVNEMRNDPEIMKTILNVKENQSPNMRGGSKLRQRPTSGIAKRSNKNFNIEARPASCSRSRGLRIRERKEMNHTDERFERIDWSKSQLENLVTQNIPTFPSEDTHLTNNQIEDILRSRTFEASLFPKCEKTLEKLKSELMLPKQYMPFHTITKTNIELVLTNCLTLFKARCFVIKILDLIHQREDLMLGLISADNPNINKYELIDSIGQEIVQTIAFLKHSRFPLNDFIYLGENYEAKIKKDNEMLRKLFPSAKPKEIFEDFNC